MADFEKKKNPGDGSYLLHYPREFIPFMTFHGTGIIDGAIFEEDGIDPTEIYRDEVVFLRNFTKL